MVERNGDERYGLGRRAFLTSGATGVAAGGLFTGDSFAQSETTVTVTQGEQSFEVEPLQYQGQTVEEFYSYDDPVNVSANTPTGLERSDTSRLFFYEGPDGLSFVVIHDEPFDGNGGEVRFEFDGLSSGGWVVRDDPTSGNERSYSLCGVTWRWNGRRTDGGAIRDVSGASFTLRPEFRSGISRVELLSGDASNPDTRELTVGEPIRFEVGTEPAGGIADAIDEKDQLIQRIRGSIPSAYTNQNQTVDARPDEFVNTVESNLGGLSSQRRDQYTEAFERLNSSEQITAEAAGRPVSEIVSQTGKAVVNAIVTIAVEAVTFGLGSGAGGVVARANRLVGDQLAATGRAVQNSITGKLARDVAAPFSRISERRIDDFGRLSDDFFSSNPDEFSAGVTAEQEETLEAALTDESITGVANALQRAERELPDDFFGPFSALANRVETEIEALFFQGYWFSRERADYEFSVPDVEVPDDLSFTFDLPLIELPLVDDDVTVSAEIGNQFENSVTDAARSFSDAVDTAEEVLDLAQNTLAGPTGIEPTLTDSTEALVDRANDGELGEQDEQARDEVRELGVTGIRRGTDAALAVYGGLQTLLDGVLLASLVIGGITLFVYAAVAAASLAGIATAPTVIVETGILLTILGVLSVVNVVLVLANVAVLGVVLELLAQFHFGTVGAINLAPGAGGDL